MTTKKQKREIAEQKRAAFEAQVKADGLDALKRDRERNEVDKARWREAQPFQERGPRYDNVTYDELAKFEGQTIPLTYENGGEVIGSGTARMTERGLEFDMFLERGKMPGIFQDSFSDVGISMSQRYSPKQMLGNGIGGTDIDKISFSPRVQHVLDPNQPLDEPFGELAQIMKANFDDHIQNVVEARAVLEGYLQVQSLSDWLDEEYKRDHGTDPDN